MKVVWGGEKTTELQKKEENQPRDKKEGVVSNNNSCGVKIRESTKHSGGGQL